jgi:thioesterase domain-containing protein
LFIVHGLGGSSLLFRQLSAVLGDDQPVYGVMLPSGVVYDRKEMEVEAVASKCFDEIRRLCPVGPYYISGHSFGALIAFEIAKQLARNGEKVGFLGLIDADRNLAKIVPGQRPPVLRTYRAKLESLAEKGIAEVFRRRMEHVRLHKRVKLAESAAATAGSTTSFEAKELMVLAAKRYNPVPYDGSAVLFRAKDEVRNESGRDLGWAELVRGEFSIVDIPGRHLTIFDEPNVRALAACFNERLSPVLSAA